MKRFLIVIAVSAMLAGCSAVSEQKTTTQALNDKPMQTEGSDISDAEYIIEQELSLEFNFGKREGVYTGTLKKGVPDGYGSFESKTPDGDKWIYYGEWSNGHFHGNGISQWESGSKYTGEYSNDLMNGLGTYWSEDGTVLYGKFENDVFVEALGSEQKLAYNSVGFGDIHFTLPLNWEMDSKDDGNIVFFPDKSTYFMVTALYSDAEDNEKLKENLDKIFNDMGNIKEMAIEERNFDNGITYLYSDGIIERDSIDFKVICLNFYYKDIIYNFSFITPQITYRFYEKTFNEVLSSIEF